MKSRIQAVSLLLLGLCGVLNANAAVITLIGNSKPEAPIILTNYVDIKSNEVAQIASVLPPYNNSFPRYFNLLFQKDGHTVNVDIDQTIGKSVGGPCRIILRTDWPNAGGQSSAWVTVNITPESFPPDKTVILPEGTVGTIHVESSTDLIQWKDEWVQTFANTNQNRFFRIRAERNLP